MTVQLLTARMLHAVRGVGLLLTGARMVGEVASLIMLCRRSWAVVEVPRAHLLALALTFISVTLA